MFCPYLGEGNHPLSETLLYLSHPKQAAEKPNAVIPISNAVPKMPATSFVVIAALTGSEITVVVGSGQYGT